MKKFLAFVMAAVLMLSCGTAFADDDNGCARIDYNGHQGYVLRTQLRTTP